MPSFEPLQPPSLDYQTVLASFPPPYPESLRTQNRQLLDTDPTAPILVVLDDDPTGTQTCHDIAVLTVWDVPSLAAEFHRLASSSRSGPALAKGFFILSNSRALHRAAARQLIGEICRNVKTAATTVGCAFEIVLRGDSTLRGHFPDEEEVVEDVLDRADGWVLAPFFQQGGRLTVGDVHYVLEPEEGLLVPAGQTQFARDRTFGYTSSNLEDWVVEKGRGSISRERVRSISLEVLRGEGPEGVCKQLMQMERGSIVIVNAFDESDMDVVVLGFLKGENQPRESKCPYPFSYTTN